MDPKLIATLLAVLGYTALEMVDGQVSLSKEEVGKLQAEHKKKFGAELVLESIEFDNEGHASFHEPEILAIETALAREATEQTTEDPQMGATAAEKKALEDQVKKLTGKVAKLEASQKKSTQTIIKLGGSSEEDVIPSPVDGKTVLTHSKTHLFATNNSFDAFTDRPWNQRAAKGATISGEYTKVDIAKVNEDLGAYYRENKTAMISFLRVKNRLPAFWNTVSNVQDEIVYSKAFTGEVTQARKKKWLPKGNFEFQPEIAKVFPIQIDLEIQGYELQSMETSWLNHLDMVSKDGSKAYKMSFVAFMAAEFLKKAAEEDQIGHIRGVHIPTADDATVAGMAIYKQSGLMKKIIEAKKRRVFKPYSLGVPTLENIVDYIDRFVMTVPEYWRDMPGMVFYMSNYWVEKYYKRRKLEDGVMPTYDPNKSTVERHENIRLVGLPFTNDSGFMFMTTDDNISFLENIPNEKNLLEIETAKRVISLIGDYKIGIHVWAFGYEYPVGQEVKDDKQIFFSNDVEILSDLYVNVDVDVTTPSVKYHTSLKTGVNTQATSITDILDASVGDFIYIKGNTGANPSTIANAGKFDLEANITLDENTLILLYKRGTDDFVEIERWDTSLSNTVFLAADATTVDADKGKHFVTAANTVATAITDILNAVDGDVYVLEGGSDANATTIAQSGKFSRISAAMTLGAGEWIKVRFNGLKFVELDRNEIA